MESESEGALEGAAVVDAVARRLLLEGSRGLKFGDFHELGRPLRGRQQWLLECIRSRSAAKRSEVGGRQDDEDIN